MLIWVVAHDRPAWGDEVHFVHTVGIFAQGVSLDLLRAYPEMSGPLTFLTYAVWSDVAGLSLPGLRLLSPLIAWGTSALWFVAASNYVGSRAAAATGLLLIVLNPYFVGLSVFVFTDMLALFGVAVVMVAIAQQRPWLVAVGVMIGTMSRQYIAFLAPAVFIADWFWQAAAHRRRWPIYGLWALAGMLPLGGLILLWGGHLAPDNGIRETYLSEGVRYDVHALSLYVSLPAAYLLPLVIPISLQTTRRAWAVAALAAAVVSLAPVQPSPAQIREGSTTVGFLHRALVAVLDPAAVTAVFVVLAAVSAATLTHTLNRRRAAWRSEPTSPLFERFLWIAVAAFLVVMPFSYMPWEKYALPLMLLVTPLLSREAFGYQRRRPRSEALWEEVESPTTGASSTSGLVIANRVADAHAAGSWAAVGSYIAVRDRTNT